MILEKLKCAKESSQKKIRGIVCHQKRIFQRLMTTAEQHRSFNTEKFCENVDKSCIKVDSSTWVKPISHQERLNSQRISRLKDIHNSVRIRQEKLLKSRINGWVIDKNESRIWRRLQPIQIPGLSTATKSKTNRYVSTEEDITFLNSPVDVLSFFNTPFNLEINELTSSWVNLV